MTYYINLGGIVLYGIQNVEDSGEREITAYDGIGQGNFPVPESRKLRTWTIECEMAEKNIGNLPNWSAASKVFTAFDVLLATKDPSRFIFVSDNRNESMSGYLTGYSKKEKAIGTYDVTVRVTEYKAAGVKTTDVPYIKRPGKVPAIPKTVTFNSKNTPYKSSQDEKKGGGADAGSKAIQGPQSSVIGGVFKVLDTKTGKYVTNPALAKDMKKYATPQKTLDEKKNDYVNSFYSKQNPKGTSSSITSAFAAIGKSLSDAVEKIRATNSKR